MFDLAVKYFKVNPRSSFEQSWYYCRNQRYISNFQATGPQVPEKIFKGYYHEQAGRHVVHVTWTSEQRFVPAAQGGFI